MPESADEIRARALEAIGRLMFDDDFPGASDEWEDWAPRYHRHAAPYVDALVAAGLLPTSVEWGARADGGPREGEVIIAGPEESAVRQHADAYPAPLTIVRRYITDWREADHD